MSARHVRVDALRLPADGGTPASGELAGDVSAALAGLLRRHGMPAPGAPPLSAPSGAEPGGGLAQQLAEQVYRALGER